MGQLCACELVDAASRSQPTVSHHLREAGLLHANKRESWMWHSVATRRIEAVISGLDALVPAPRRLQSRFGRIYKETECLLRHWVFI